MRNPYASPTVAVEDIELPDYPYQPQIFSKDGRIGRLRYVVYTAVVMLVTIIVAGIVAAVAIPMLMKSNNGNPVVAVAVAVAAYVPALYGMVIMAKRRLHDLNHTGWLAILLFLPLINLVMSLYLLFWPGNKDRNDYGPAPVKNSLGVILVALLLLLVNIGFVVFALGAYQDYVQRAQATQLQMQMQQPQH